MYLPKHFEETRVAVLHDLIRAHPLGTLVTSASGRLEANHIPFEIDPEPAPFGTLYGHMARASPHWCDFSSGVDALVVFQGPNTYVSPSWYASKQEHGKVVPTWNYAVVHAHGPVRAVEDAEWLRALVEKLTDRHETGRARRWKVSDAPTDYIDKLLAAIVGIELPIVKLLGKWKVSQNRPAGDREGVVAGLHEQGNDVANAMAELVRAWK